MGDGKKQIQHLNEVIQGGPLPVLSRVITPLIGVITPVTQLQGILKG